jgi:anti-sigma regulatory factor (Ser/Thr protein kinase)
MTGRLRHEAAAFGSSDAMLSVVVPLLDEAVATGVPAIVRFGDDWAAPLRERLAAPERVEFVGGGADPNPIRAVRAMREAALAHLADGADQVRLLGSVPDSSLASGASWEQWARYEAAFNETFADVPAWAVCCYPTWPGSQVTDDVASTHSRLGGVDGWRESPSYVDPRCFVADRKPTPAERLDAGPPAIELHDPHPAIARDSARRLGERAGLDAGQVDDFVLGANEVITNAFLHGRKPVVVRGWVGDGALLLTVRDGGSGVADPFIGMLQPGDNRSVPGGYGIWLARMCSDLVSFSQDADGFTVRMTALSD